MQYAQRTNSAQKDLLERSDTQPAYTQKQQKIEWGFYAVVPRIVRTHYKQLSHAEKWLYTCLKDLCGDKGICFRTIRSLSEETGISTGSLSTMIPNLHKAGLIHAEKKKRSAAGREVWHISIVDVWKTNRNICSKSEQMPETLPANVQKMNQFVQILNGTSPECSENEPVCSDFGDRRKNSERKNNNEERTIEEADIAVTQEEQTNESNLAATALTILRKIPENEVRQLLKQLTAKEITQQSSAFGEMPPAVPLPLTKQADNSMAPIPQEEQTEDDNSAEDSSAPALPEELEPPQKPALDAPRDTETIVSLVEYLRGQRYTPGIRLREIRAARRLLTLQPEYSLIEIEEAWRHGSDDYWRSTHGGENLHVHDLVNIDSHGQYRVKAFLAHKRVQDRRIQQAMVYDRQEVKTPPTVQSPQQPASSQPVLSEEQARAIIEQIARDAVTHGYEGLRGEAQNEGSGWVVRVTWPTLFAWKGNVKLMMRSAKQWERDFSEWDEILQLRAQRQRREV